MPPKIRELIAELERNGFVNRGGKGNHRNFRHSYCSKIVRLSGKIGEDAKDYQLKQVKVALKELKKK